MKIFISYSHLDKKLAGAIKGNLEFYYYFDVFLAHEDIEPSSEWEAEIISQLKSCDAFIALLTNNFNNSEWTNQEVGIALERGVQIIAINAGANPHGFIKRYQALKHEEVDSTIEQILKILLANGDIREKVLDALVRAFGKSRNYIVAGKKINQLLEYDEFLSTHQKNEIILLATRNKQIYESHNATKRLGQFIKKYKDELDGKLVEQVKKKIYV